MQYEIRLHSGINRVLRAVQGEVGEVKGELGEVVEVEVEGELVEGEGEGRMRPARSGWGLTQLAWREQRRQPEN